MAITGPSVRHLPDGSVELNGVRCDDCGAVAFPSQSYGCEACGAHGARLAPAQLSASGRLRNWATVRRHHRPWPSAPFIVGTVILDAGPAIRAVFAENTKEEDLIAGGRVVGLTIPAPDGDELAFRLTPATEEAAR